MSERCNCCDLPVESCGKQAEDRERAEMAAETNRLLARGWFAAKFAGECSGCGTPFDAGALIKLHTVTGAHRCYIAACCQVLA